MKGYKYGAESCTIVPIILTLPQLCGIPWVLFSAATRADGKILSRDSASVMFDAKTPESIFEF